MKRRSFLKNISLAGLGPLVLNGLPINVLANSGQLQKLAFNSNNDKVLVLIQLHGGNDGLNTIIPLNQYSLYYNLRPNIAIPDNGMRKYITLDSTLADEAQIGLHPDMQGFKSLYDAGKAAVVQSVAYENINGSHFRSRDIWFMGGDYNDNYGSGWMGRYLNSLYPGYPDAYPSNEMPDPLALEIGTRVSLGFHRENGIPAGIAINNPEQFYDLIKNVGVEPPAEVAKTNYGEELKWIIGIEEKSNQYAERLQQVFAKGSNSNNVLYPETYPYNAPKYALRNPLTGQLKTIARLLSGGCKTKIFLARIGGFDTHASQVESYDSTMGTHAALLYHMFSAVKAFQDDLKGLGLEDRVMTVTFSEFGRRAESNGSYGTDHGTSAPMFVFGKHVRPGVIGSNPGLSDTELIRGKNLDYQHDYRQVFTTLLHDWMEAPADAMTATKFESFIDKKLPLVGGKVTGTDDFFSERFALKDCYPNPAVNNTTIRFRINNELPVSLKLMDMNGKLIKNLLNEVRMPGWHEVKVNVSDLSTGTYLYTINAGPLKQTKKLIVKK